MFSWQEKRPELGEMQKTSNYEYLSRKYYKIFPPTKESNITISK